MQFPACTLSSADFCLRIAHAGARTWFAVYRHGGRLRWFKIGDAPNCRSPTDAREMARNVLADVQKGNDLAADKSAARKAESSRTFVNATSTNMRGTA